MELYNKIDMLHINILSLPGRCYFYYSACSVSGKALYHGPLAAGSLCPDGVCLPCITQTDEQANSNQVILKILTFICIIYIQPIFIYDNPHPESFLSF